MSGLLPRDAIHEIFEKAIGRGLEKRRDALLQGLGLYAATLETSNVPGDQLLLDLFALNSVTRLIGDILPLRLWLENAALAVGPLPEADYFRGRAGEIVAQPEPTPEQAKANAEQTLALLDQWAADNPALREAIRAASDQLDAISKRLKPLAALKRLHDHLHNFQVSSLQVLQAVLLQGNLANGITRDVVKGTVTAIDTLIRSGENEVEHLVGTREHAEQLDYLGELRRVKTRLTSAIDARSMELAEFGLGALRTLLRNWMPVLNVRLSYKADDLDITGLIDQLRRFASLSDRIDDSRSTRLREAATQLGVLHGEIAALIAEHDRWQRIDNDFWSMEENLLFGGEKPVALQAFSELWPAVVDKVERIAAGTPGWLDDARRHVQSFATHCPMPATSPIRPDAIEEFGDFIKAARLQFFDVDAALNRRCTRLSAITDPLEALARGF